MSNSRETELMNNSNRYTEVMPNNIGGSRVTEIMSEGNASGVSYDGNNIGGYIVKDVISENTGEASLLLAVKQDIDYIIKLYHKNKQPNTELVKVVNELSSKYIIKAVETGVYNGRHYEVLPYYKNGDLTKHAPISYDVLKNSVIPCVNEGLKDMHNKNIVHRDIKPSNLFVSDDKKTIIIGDFGISSVLDKSMSVRATDMSRTFGYAAPETANGFVSKESDYYSFGITLLHLVTGQDPFYGMTDMEILYQTINKNLIVPEYIDVRLQNLIKGLTLKDRNDRWGYDEIVRWLNGEDIPIKEPKRVKHDYKPYNFNYNKYYGLKEISMAFANDWENAKKHLYRGLVEKNVAQYGEEYAVAIADLKEEPDKDLAVFKMIYVLNPQAPLCYRGKVYYDLESIGVKMRDSLPDFDEEVFELITKGCLYDFLIENNFDKILCDRVKEIENKMNSGDRKYYYALMYLLSPESKFSIQHRNFSDIESMVVYLESLSPSLIEELAGILVDDDQFLMWVYAQGYAAQINQWLEIYEKAEW